MEDYQPTSLYRKLWSKLTPSTQTNTERRKSQNRSNTDQLKSMDKIRAHIRKRLSKRTQRRYIRNPVSSIRALSGRKQSGRSSERSQAKPWYSDGFPEFRLANEVHTERRKQHKVGGLQRNKSIFFNEDGDEVPYYRSKSVDYTRRRDSTFTPVINEQDIINKVYTGRDIALIPRPSSLPGMRKRRDSGPFRKTIKHVSPHRRTSKSIGRLQTDVVRDVTKLYTDRAPSKKEMRSSYSVLTLSEDTNRPMKQNLKNTTELAEAFRKIERLKQQKYKSNVHYSGLTNSPSRETIHTKFGDTKKTKRVVPINTQNRSLSKQKLDPIHVSSDTRNRTHQKKNSNYLNTPYTTLPDVHTIENGIKHDTETGTCIFDDSDFGTVNGTDSTAFETFETLSTAVACGGQSPVTGSVSKTLTHRSGSVSKNDDHTPSRMKTRRKSSIKVPVTGERKASTVRGTIRTAINGNNENENHRTSCSNDEDEIVELHKDRVSRAVLNDDIIVHTAKERQNSISKGESVKAQSDKSHRSDQYVSTDSRDQGFRSFEDSLLHTNTGQGGTRRENPVHFNEQDDEHSCVEIEATLNPSISNSTIKVTKHKERIIVDKTRINHSPKSGKRSPVNRKDNVSLQPSIQMHKLNKRTTSSDIVVGRQEYERKGHRITTNKNNKLSQNTSGPPGTNNIQEKLTEYDQLATDITSPVTTTLITEREIVKNATADEALKEPIHWNEVAKKHAQKSSTESVSINERKETGTNQWRDLVQKYLKQPVPTIGKSSDRKLLDTVDSEDDDDDEDIFERARKKYSLEIDSDDSESV